MSGEKWPNVHHQANHSESKAQLNINNKNSCGSIDIARLYLRILIHVTSKIKVFLMK